MPTLTSIDLVVAVATLAAIGWVNWYFLAAHAAPVAATTAAGGARQEATIVVRGGYSPATVRVAAGRPVRLLFDRQETSGCSEEVVIPAFGVRSYLPAHETTAVEVTAPAPGSYEFTCGMGMLRGRLVAE
jgi:plastocyanin domain-containing protein